MFYHNTKKFNSGEKIPNWTLQQYNKECAQETIDLNQVPIPPMKESKVKELIFPSQLNEHFGFFLEMPL